jgi:hypothetical protein
VFDELGQPRCQHRRPVPAPHAFHPAQRLRLFAGGDQLPQHERVAPAGLPHPLGEYPIGRPAQVFGQHLLDIGAQQLLEIDPFGQPVAPQRGDGLGGRLAGAHRYQDERGRVLHELVQQRRGQVIQQVRVIHAQHQPPAACRGRQRVGGPAQQVDTAAGRGQLGGKQRRQRAERDQPRRLGRHHPPCHPPVWVGCPQRLIGQPGLAHPGRPGQNDPTGILIAHRCRDQGKLLLPARKRPARVHPHDGTARMRHPLAHSLRPAAGK